MNVVEATGLGRRYGRRWALRDLTVSVPEGAIVGLVGPNGAGKSTLLHLVAGLIEADEGTVHTFGAPPSSPAVLPELAFVAQDAPLPRRARIDHLMASTRAMNVRWDDNVVWDRCDELALERQRRIDSLSGGQRAQLALSLALAKQPRLLVLDEPVAALDPLARRNFLATVVAAAAERALTVVFSTHQLDDVERICDHLIVLAGGTVRVGGPVDEIVARHRVLIGPPHRSLPPGARAIGPGPEPQRHQHLVELDRPVLDPTWEQVEPTLEEIVFARLGESAPASRPLEAI